MAPAEVTCVSFMGAVSNLANAAVGAGVLAFPVAFMYCGLVLGIVVSLFFALLMGFTLHILAVASDMSKAESYQGVIEHALGSTAGLVVKCSMTLYLLGALVAYLNLIKDQIESIAGHYPALAKTPLDNSWVVVPIVAIGIVGPLCLLKNLDSLQFTSFLAVLSVVFLEGDVVYRSAEFLHNNGGKPAPGVINFNWSMKVFASVPLIAFALQCHLVFVPVYHSLAKQGGNPKLMDFVSAVTFLVCLGLYLPTGALGYMHFGTATNGDVLTNMGFHADTNVARVCIALTGLFSYPLLMYVARTSLSDLIDALFTRDNKTKLVDDNWRFYGLTAGFLVTSAVVSAAVDDLSVVLGVTGSTAAVVQVFIMPGLVWNKVNSQDENWQLHYTVGWSLVVFGVVIGAVALWQTLAPA